MKNQQINTAASREFRPLLFMTGLTLFVGIAIDFAPELIWYDQQRIEQIALLLIAALAFATILRKTLTISLARLTIPSYLALASGFTLGAASITLSAYPRFAALEWSTLLLLIGVVFALAEQSRIAGASFDIFTTRLVVALTTVIVLKILAGYLAAIFVMKHLDTVMLFEGTFSNRRFFGQVASMMIPLLAYPLLRTGLYKRVRILLFTLLSLWWMLVIASGTRGTWMALAISAALLAIFAWRACAGWLRVQALAFVAGALLFGIMFIWLPNWYGLDASLENRLSNLVTLSSRDVLWSLAWVQIQAHPWLGIGPMHFATLRNDVGAHPHNAILQLASEWGIPAALALIFPVMTGMLNLLTRLRRTTSPPNILLVCLTASLLAACVQSMVDGVIVIPYTQTLLALIAGWALGVYFRDIPMMPVAATSRMQRLWVPVLSVVALAALLNGIFPEVMNRVEITQAYVKTGKFLAPRYWGVGWIP
jgi:O-antigen ligase